MEEVNDLLERLGELEDAPLIWINKKVYDMAQEIKKLKEEYMILQNASDEVEEELRQRIDKAIEYIENKNKYLDSENYYQVFEYRDIYLKPLLDILKGSDKE